MKDPHHIIPAAPRSAVTRSGQRFGHTPKLLEDRTSKRYSLPKPTIDSDHPSEHARCFWNFRQIYFALRNCGGRCAKTAHGTSHLCGGTPEPASWIAI